MKRSFQEAEAASSSASKSARPQSSQPPVFEQSISAVSAVSAIAISAISALDQDIFIHLNKSMKECKTRQEVVTVACTCLNPLQMRLANSLNEESRTSMSEQDWRIIKSFAKIPEEGSADLLLLEQETMLCGILNIDRAISNTTDSLEITIAVPTRHQRRSYSKLLIAVAVLIGYVEGYPILSYPSGPIMKTILTNFDAVICLGDKLFPTTHRERMSKTDAENVVQEYDSIKRNNTVQQIGDTILKIDNSEANLKYATTLLVSIPKLCYSLATSQAVIRPTHIPPNSNL